MSDDWKDDRLKELYSDASVPQSLEDRTVANLRRRGLLGPSRVLWRKRVTRVLAPAALFVLGFALGQMDEWRNKPSDRAQYMILLFESPGLPIPSRIDEGRIVEEYRDWGLRLASEGRAVSGERLGRDRRILTPLGGPSIGAQAGWLAGFFLIESESLEEAVRLAESHPHRRYGGVIEVRAIDLP